MGVFQNSTAARRSLGQNRVDGHERRPDQGLIHQVFREQGAPAYALGLPYTGRRPHPAVHQRRDGALQALLHGRADASFAPLDQQPEEFPDHRHRRSGRSQAPDLLRDAGQFQHRRLFQRRGGRFRLGAGYPAVRAGPRPVVRDHPPGRRRGLRHLARPGGSTRRPHLPLRR